MPKVEERTRTCAGHSAQGPFCTGADKEPESRVDVAFRAKVGFLDVAQSE